MRFYPEDGKGHLSEAFHGSRWVRDMHPAVLTPMIRVRAHDFYVFEPAMLRSGNVVLVHRWLTEKGGKGMLGRAWEMRAQVGSEAGAWCVDQRVEVKFTEAELLLNFPCLEEVHRDYCVPTPSAIRGAYELRVCVHQTH
jgi:hypothetical protein